MARKLDDYLKKPQTGAARSLLDILDWNEGNSSLTGCIQIGIQHQLVESMDDKSKSVFLPSEVRLNLAWILMDR